MSKTNVLDGASAASKEAAPPSGVTPYVAVDLEITGAGYTKLFDRVETPVAEGDNPYEAWLIPDRQIAYAFAINTLEGQLTVDKLLEMLKCMTYSWSADGDGIMHGSHWPVDVVGWDPIIPPTDWTLLQIDNWKQSWQEAKDAWNTSVGYTLINLVPNAQAPTSQTIWRVEYGPMDSDNEYVAPGGAVGEYLVGGKFHIGAGLRWETSQGRLFYAEHVFGHAFGLYDIYDIPAESYLMFGFPGIRFITPDEADLVKIIHNIAPANMSKYPIPEHD
jgi:hypothetical protein